MIHFVTEGCCRFAIHRLIPMRLKQSLRSLILYSIVLFLTLLYRVEAGYAQYTNQYYDNVSETMETYSVPAFVKITSISFSQPQPGTSQLSITTQAPIPLSTNDRFTFEAYFNAISSDEYRFDTGVVSSHGSYTYPSTPSLPPGTAGVVDVPSGILFGDAHLSISGSTVTITFDGNFVGNTNPNLVVIRYLPGHVDLSRASGGVSACFADTRVLDPNLIDRKVILPGHPAASSGGASGAKAGTRAAAVPTQPTRITIGPPPGSSCPPLPSDNVPKPADVNGDGVTDWDYSGDDKIPSTNLVIGTFGIDKGAPGAGGGDEFRYGIGNDDNGNGQLDPSEIDDWVGKCPWPNGQNYGWIEKVGNNWYVHRISDDAPAGDRKKIHHFIYDVTNDRLKVYDENGLIYQGPPEGYSW